MIKNLIKTSFIHITLLFMYCLLIEVLVKYFNIQCTLFKIILALLFGIYCGRPLIMWVCKKLIQNEKKR